MTAPYRWTMILHLTPEKVGTEFLSLRQESRCEPRVRFLSSEKDPFSAYLPIPEKAKGAWWPKKDETHPSFSGAISGVRFQELLGASMTSQSPL